MKPVSGKRMCQILESKGWVRVRITGSHHVYRHPVQRRRAIVPVHGNKDLKPKTQYNIMRDAGLSRADLR
jgi:predicted RNA binding protein YcfA (HicA-like mRNA interferase family)